MHLFNFTTMQIDLLAHIARVEAGKKLELRFDDPEQDTRNIRRAIYLDGTIEMLQYLVDFDDKLKQEKEKEKQQLMADTPAVNPAEFTHPNLEF